jgi:hypothetical protein
MSFHQGKRRWLQMSLNQGVNRLAVGSRAESRRRESEKFGRQEGEREKREARRIQRKAPHVTGKWKRHKEREKSGRTFILEHLPQLLFGHVPRIAHLVRVRVERDVFGRKEDVVDCGVCIKQIVRREKKRNRRS